MWQPWRHVTSSDTWYSIRHRPFPIGGPLEPSRYLYRFLEILGPKHIAISFSIRGGPDLRKWRRAEDGCVTPLTFMLFTTNRFIWSNVLSDVFILLMKTSSSGSRNVKVFWSNYNLYETVVVRQLGFLVIDRTVFYMPNVTNSAGKKLWHCVDDNWMLIIVDLLLFLVCVFETVSQSGVV